ncbi:hypothetical protein EJA00_04720 [Streptococcus suis]|uniref:Uncharacterized protein n=1 Tax=Streptococcus suis TaxID=1307 RepID=A0A3R8T3U4_STRSU|nr:hypothetical protein EJA00_04720 [Streptococcus suis]
MNTGYFLIFKERNTSSFIRTQAKNLVKKINLLVCFTHCVSFLFSYGFLNAFCIINYEQHRILRSSGGF